MKARQVNAVGSVQGLNRFGSRICLVHFLRDLDQIPYLLHAPVLSPVNVIKACLPGLLRGLNEVKFVMCLSLCLARSGSSGHALHPVVYGDHKAARVPKLQNSELQSLNHWVGRGTLRAALL